MPLRGVAKHAVEGPATLVGDKDLAAPARRGPIRGARAAAQQGGQRGRDPVRVAVGDDGQASPGLPEDREAHLVLHGYQMAEEGWRFGRRGLRRLQPQRREARAHAGSRSAAFTSALSPRPRAPACRRWRTGLCPHCSGGRDTPPRRWSAPSGSAGSRVSDSTARPRSRPAATCGASCGEGSTAKSSLPAIRSETCRRGRGPRVASMPRRRRTARPGCVASVPMPGRR